MERFKDLILLICDLVVVVFSYFVAVWIRMDLSFINISIYQSFIDQMWLILIIYLVIFKIMRIDKTIHTMASVEEAIRVLLTCTLGTITTYIVLYIIKFDPVPRSIFLIQAIILILVLEFWRFSYRIYSMLQNKMKSKGSEFSRTIIVGAGAAGVMLLRELTTNRTFKNQIIAFIDDDPKKTGKTIGGIKIFGTTDDLDAIVNNHQIEVIYVAMPSAKVSEQQLVLKKCYETGCKVMILTSTQDMISTGGIRRSIREIGIEDLLGRDSIQLENSSIHELVSGKVVLVTGAAGSIGMELCRQIIQHSPKQLLLVDINENGIYDLQQEFNIKKTEGMIGSNIEYIPIITSIREITAIHRLFEKYKPQIVFHAAAHKHVPLMEEMPIEAIKNNIFGTNNLIQSAKLFGVERFVSISTDKAVNPTNVMGATKRFVEKIIQSMDSDTTKFIAVRFGNVLGSNGSIIPLFKRQIESGGPLTLTDKRIIRYFMTIPEAVSLVLQAATYGEGGEIFVLDMGKPVKILDLAEKMIKLAGFVPYKDIDIIEIGLRPGEKLYEELHLAKEDVTTTPNNLIFITHPIKISREIIEEELAFLNEAISNQAATDEEIVADLVKVVDNYQPNRKGIRVDV